MNLRARLASAVYGEKLHKVQPHLHFSNNHTHPNPSSFCKNVLGNLDPQRLWHRAIGQVSRASGATFCIILAPIRLLSYSLSLSLNYSLAQKHKPLSLPIKQPHPSKYTGTHHRAATRGSNLPFWSGTSPIGSRQLLTRSVHPLHSLTQFHLIC